MQPKWVLEYVASEGTILHKPLSDGQCLFQKGQPFTVTNFEDYRRLVNTHRGEFVEISNNLDEIIPKEENVTEPTAEPIGYPITKPKAEPTLELNKEDK
ncbi:MAG TPA: hypothetical protein VKR58_05960 [Aquella sp.]|nr:hypothetical protein [Aquella sp.]